MINRNRCYAVKSFFFPYGFSILGDNFTIKTFAVAWQKNLTTTTAILEKIYNIDYINKIKIVTTSTNRHIRDKQDK